MVNDFIYLSLFLFFSIIYQSHSWCLTTTIQQNYQISEVDWAPDNSIFVTASLGEKVVRIYSTKTFQILSIYNNNGAIPNSVKISRNSLYIGIGYANGSICVLNNTANFPFFFTLDTGHGSVTEVDFNSGTTQIFTCGGDQRYKSFNIATRAVNITDKPTPAGTPTACRIAHNGFRVMADTSSRVRAFDISYATYFNITYTDVIVELDYLPSSTQFATVSRDNTFRVNNVSLFNDTDDLLSVSVGRQGKHYAIGSKLKTLRIYDVLSSSFIAKFNLRDQVISTRLSQDENFLIAADKSGQIKIFSSVCPMNCQSGQYNSSGICKKCYQAIKYCMKCQSAGTCQYCMGGYYTTGSSCSPCYTNLNYCLLCRDSGTCLRCQDGYYLNSLNRCRPCTDNLTGCNSCDNNITCTQCIHLQFYLDNNTNSCKSCVSAIQNCIKCYDNTTCIQCQIGFYQNGNSTPQCRPCLNNCLNCQSSTNCTECKMGYWANSSGLCVRCTDTNCISCNSTGICFDCQQGTYLASNSTCTICSNPCATCIQTSNNCTSCLIGYLFNYTTNLCQRCIQNCIICNQTAKCLSCYPSFRVDSNTSTCRPCSLYFANCSQCTNSKCINCFDGFYLDRNASNVCKSCISNIPECMSCYNSSTCIQCAIGFYNTYLTGIDACAPCRPGCSQCISATNCTNCFQTFYKNSSNLCQPCINYCYQCLGTNTCMSCIIGYYLDNTTCKSCQTAISFCAQCINSTVCISCGMGSYLDSADGTCNLCTSNCTACNKTDCFSCEVGYYLATSTPKKCLKCSFSCQQCTSSSVCSSCIDGYYFDSSDSKCKTCTSLFSFCSLCNKTHCLQCHRGRQLNLSSTNYKCQLCTKYISNCNICYRDYSTNTSAVKCNSCLYGYGLSASSLSCFECNDIAGCISCKNSSKCTKCEIGYYLKNDYTCGLCSSKCQSCNNSTSCLTCVNGYVYDTNTSSCVLCEDKVQGCSKCVQNGMNTFECSNCQIGYYLQSATKNCVLCIDRINGCYTCNSSTICTSCLDKYYLNPNTSKCSKCGNGTSMIGCQLCNSSTVCIKCSNMYYLQSTDKKCYYCSNNVPGCLYCKNKTSCSECNSGYYLTTGNTCSLCQSQIQGCNYCTNTTFCVLCRSGYYLSTTDNKCHSCNQPGCQVCSQSQANSCVTCNSKFYLSGSNCLSCRSRVPNCQTCTSIDCTNCEVGYYKNNSTFCQQCSLVMQGCSRCYDSSTCLQCMSSYFLNSSNLCQQCNTKMFGCQNCINQTVCISCSANYFLNGSTNLCQPCTDVSGCVLCKDGNTCVMCQQKYFLDSTTFKCSLCSSFISGCFSCATDTVCVQCQSGYVLQTTTYKCTVNTVQAKQKVQSLKIISYYLNSQTLKHILYAKGMNFKKVDISTLNITSNGKTRIFIEDYTGKQTQLNILWYEFSATNDYSIIFYTDNPINDQIEKTKSSINFRRLLAGNDGLIQINLQVLLKMDTSIYQKILPELDYQGSLTVGYSLNNPQFTNSYMKTQQGNYFKYRIFGVIIIGLFFLNYIIKFFITIPTSKNHSNILPHIIAIKACNVIMQPKYFQYVYFCSGFMVVDLPWMNSTFSQYLTNQSDFVQVPFGLFFNNMNLAATFLFGLCVYFGLILIVQAFTYILSEKVVIPQNSARQSDLSSQEQRKKNKNQLKKLQQSLGINYENQNYENDKVLLFKKNVYDLIWNLVIFSCIYYSCLGVQGAYYNPLSFLSLYGLFYILSIFLFLFMTVQTIYSCLRNMKSINKLRIYLKACLLCLSHLNPIYIVCVCIVLDTTLAVIEYHVIYKKNTFTKVHIIIHTIPNITIGLLIFAPSNLTSLLCSASILLVSLILQIYVHLKQFHFSRKNFQQQDFNIQENQSKIPQNQQSIIGQKDQKNVKQFQMTNFFDLENNKPFKDMDMYATVQQFGITQQNQMNREELDQMQLSNEKQKRLTSNSVFSYKKSQKRNKLKKTLNQFNPNSLQVIFPQSSQY